MPLVYTLISSWKGKTFIAKNHTGPSWTYPGDTHISSSGFHHVKLFEDKKLGTHEIALLSEGACFL